MLKATIRFFDIKKCGFYRRGSNQTEFSSLDDTLDNLNSWAGDGRELINTVTYKADSDNDLKNTYFCNWHKNNLNGDSILILWNEVPNDKGVIYGMNSMEKPGKTSMLTTGFNKESTIPGFPSYFWFIPEKKVFSTIKFEHSIQGKNNLDHYLNGFLVNKSPYRVVDEEEAIIGYSLDGKQSTHSAKIYPKFLAIAKKQEELKDELLANRPKIRKIIKREELTYALADDRKVLERVFSKLLSNPPTFTKVRSITHELQFEPTESELLQIIDNYAELGPTNSIQNVGFIYSDGKRVMLNGIGVTLTVEINATRKDNHIITPQSLLNAITSQRHNLLKPLGQSALEVKNVVAQ